ncbi:MAG: N-acetylmuramoyl-L-alanine amidase family protein [Lachnospiraceae bacterium]
MSRIKNWLAGVLMLAVLSTSIAFPGYAGVISSVTITVTSQLNPGEKLPSIGISNNGDTSAEEGDIVVSVSSDRYYISNAEWVTSTTRTMEVGDEAQMKVTLSPLDSNEDYFKGTYRSSNVSVKKGTFVSASLKSGDLVVKLKANAIKGTFTEPQDAYWKDGSKGTAKWTKPSEGGTGYYEVVLRRGSSQVHKIETSSTSYNFYPYMTTAGTYSFRVRTIAKTSTEDKYGTKSSYVASDELYIAKEDVSDGSGQSSSGSDSSTTGNTNVGWRQSGDYWYYYYPDGTYVKNNWAQVNGKWYLFQEDGKMLRGWQTTSNNTYYLSDNGDMVSGWIKNGTNWYYLSQAEGDGLGAMLKNCWGEANGNIYYFTSNGAMAEGWYQVDGNWYYFYPGQGNRATDTWVDTFYVDENGVWRR